jgi:hypothetical protein
VDAQTNLQLYRQLIQAKWDETALLMIRGGYELAIQLFADAYRSSRRPFVAHLVGTASVLASWQERPVMVAAGVLHAAYLYGYFGDGQKGITAARRQVVTQAVGEEAEQLIRDYTLTREDELERFCAMTTLTPIERDVATLQLANLYDDFRDGEAAVAPQARVNPLPYFVGGGVSYQGLVPGRGSDIAAVGVIAGIFSHVIPRTTAETVLEVNYQITVTRWLSVTPDLQYIIRPSGSSAISNAVVVGVQLAMTL